MKEMYRAELFDIGVWWVFPLVMIVLCFFMMRRRRGSMMCGFGFRGDSDRARTQDSAKDILDERYARGEIDRTEYEEKRQVLAGERETHTG